MKHKITKGTTLFFVAVSALFTIMTLHIKPIQLKAKVFVYEYKKDVVSRHVEDYISAPQTIIDKAMLDMSSVKESPGVYPASINYMKRAYRFTIKVVEPIKPMAKAKRVQLHVNPNTEVWANDVLTILDKTRKIHAYFLNEDGSLVSHKAFSTDGQYIENLIAKDQTGNRSPKFRVKIIVGRLGDKPILEGVDEITIKVGSVFDPMQGVNAYNNDNQDITKNIVIIGNTVNTKEKGIYEVIYKVVDDNNLMTQRSRKVIVR